MNRVIKHARTWLLAAALVAGATSISSAQGLYKSWERVNIQYAGPTSCSEAASETGFEGAAEIPGEGLVSLKRPWWMPKWLFIWSILFLDWDSGTVFAEGERRIGLPEIDGCTVSGESASVQQCTVGFVSGDETDAAEANEVWLQAIGATAAQSLATGDGPVIAVIDTGIDPNHPAFAGKLAGDGWDYVNSQPGGWDLPDGYDDDGDGLVDEAFGHGTHVAGTILTLHPNAKIIPYRVLDNEGNGWSFDVACAIWKAHLEGADFVNLSLGMIDETKAVSHRIGSALEAGLEVFTASGNTGTEWVLYPGTLGSDVEFYPWVHPPAEGVVSVGAVDALGLWAPFSGYGSAVDLVAPGVDIHGPSPGGQYAAWSGTSMACAVACGSAALVHSAAAPGAGTAASHLIATATSVDDLNPGQSAGLGTGMIDVFAAALSAATGEPVDPHGGMGGDCGDDHDDDDDDDGGGGGWGGWGGWK